ncbi:MAG: hypothetical protein RIC14_14265 [Filomicrobium sp.]
MSFFALSRLFDVMWMRGVAGVLAVVVAFVVPANAGGKKVDAAVVTRPADVGPYTAPDGDKLLAEGKKLFDSLKISENGLTCKSCHFKYEAYEESFLLPYPHAVGMAKKRAGMDAVEADEMVQLCLVITMDSKPLPWESRELAALTAYVLDQQRGFIAHKGN